MTPFEVVYGRPPTKLQSYIPGLTTNQAVDEILKTRDQILSTLKLNLAIVQDRMKFQVDRKRTEWELAVGDRAVQRVGQVAYKVDLLSHSSIHPVFHRSCLKKKLGQQHSPLSTLPPVDLQGELMAKPEAILQRRIRQVKNWAVVDVLVQWRGG
ncbi:uncharacterized protein LOC122301665 [Carya illinoinensis]|uniref:uncharacterized protein LOC122301665 n=1 Tax=Carya illinoinensis TaxID=32201 RepID=UPI001C71B7C2|nr:uncharacterized protein LOC122301665 [Carya illinoinensis]